MDGVLRRKVVLMPYPASVYSVVHFLYSVAHSTLQGQLVFNKRQTLFQIFFIYLGFFT